MTQIIKKKVFKALKAANLNITDNGKYEEKFPWVILRLGNKQSAKYFDTRITTITFAIDIFSIYSGEQEILELEEKITPIMENVEDSRIMGVSLSSFKILDDNSKGPVNKHGVLTYIFLLDTTLDQDQEEEKDDDTEGN